MASPPRFLRSGTGKAYGTYPPPEAVGFYGALKQQPDWYRPSTLKSLDQVWAYLGRALPLGIRVLAFSQ